MYGDFKRAVYRKEIKWVILYWPRKNILQIIFFLILGKSVLSEYMENTLTAKKSTEIKHLMINYRTIRKKF